MKAEVGMIVRANAGRDNDRFFLVQSIDKNYAYIVDGKTRKLSSPKRKNQMHLCPTNTIVSMEGITNRKIRDTLKVYFENSMTGKGRD